MNVSIEAESKIPAKKVLKTSVQRAHEYLGHLNEDMTRAAAAHLGMTLSRGALPTCNCKGKATQYSKEC